MERKMNTNKEVRNTYITCIILLLLSIMVQIGIKKNQEYKYKQAIELYLDDYQSLRDLEERVDKVYQIYMFNKELNEYIEKQIKEGENK